MNQIDLDYQNLVRDILENGSRKNDRTKTGTISVFGRTIRHSMKDGFPLLTTKKMAWKTMVTELLWFLRGDTNIKYLVDNGCHIWDGDAWKHFSTVRKSMLMLKPPASEDKLREYIEWYEQITTQEEFINKIKTDDEFAKKWGNLGPVYGKQWRSWESYDFCIDNDFGNNAFGGGWNVIHIDQIANVINLLKTDPDNRRMIVSAWNPADLSAMVLPPCHMMFQFYTRELSESEIWDYIHKNKIEIKHQHAVLYGHEVGSELRKSFIPTLKENYNIPTRAISLRWDQRSVDVGLGLPFNIASYALLLEIIAKEVNMVPEELIGDLGDCHIYNNHVDGLKEQLTRVPYELPKLKIEDEVKWKEGDCLPTYSVSDFTLENYQSHPSIKLPLSN